MTRFEKPNGEFRRYHLPERRTISLEEAEDALIAAEGLLEAGKPEEAFAACEVTYRTIYSDASTGEQASEFDAISERLAVLTLESFRELPKGIRREFVNGHLKNAMNHIRTVNQTRNRQN